jgi:hypothetical protein
MKPGLWLANDNHELRIHWCLVIFPKSNTAMDYEETMERHCANVPCYMLSGASRKLRLRRQKWVSSKHLATPFSESLNFSMAASSPGMCLVIDE